MAKYSIRIESYVPVDSVENDLLNVDWIKSAVKEAGYRIDRYRFESNFTIGELSCTCESEEELKTEALGQSVNLSTTIMYFFSGKKHISFFLDKNDSANKGKNIFITCNDKTMLSSIVACLRKKAAQKSAGPTGSVVINASNVNSSNIVVGSGNTASVSMGSASGKKSFWKDIWAGILKNIIWVIVVAIILLVLAYLGITQPNWLRL